MDTELTKVDETQHEVVEQIVTFHEDGDVVVEEETPPEVPMSYLKVAEDDLTHSVKDILERPIEMKNFNWTLAQAAGTEIDGQQLPEDWLAVPMIRQKLTGFTYFRGGFDIKVQVNAQPFHAGALLIVFEPLQDQQTYNPSNLLHFGGITGYRHVVLDLSEATTATLHVPFLANVTHFDLVKAIGQLGRVRVLVYSALTGTSDVEGTIWVSAKDVHVDMPTGILPWPREVGVAQSKSGSRPSRIPVPTKSGPKVVPPKETQKEEKAKFPPGFFTSVALGVKAASRAIMGVPVIAPYAACVSWLAGAAAGICSIFGWSKPVDRLRVKMVQLVYGRTAANYNGDCKAKVMALDSHNEVVVPTDVFGTEKDEMALGHVLAQPTFLDRFQMLKAHTPGQLIWKMPVSPRACNKIINGYKIINLNTMLSYTAEMFSNWRGTLKYSFRIVKTPYHSARVRLAFVPSAFEDTPTEGIDINMIYSKIIDIREVNMFDFEVPFVFNQPWMSLADIQRDLTSASLPTGMLYVEVLNALRNPSSAADFIEFIVEVSAGDDFQFSYPRINRNTHLMPALQVSTFQSVSSEVRTLPVRALGVVKNLKYTKPEADVDKIGAFKQFKVFDCVEEKGKKKEGGVPLPSGAPKEDVRRPKSPSVVQKLAEVGEMGTIVPPKPAERKPTEEKTEGLKPQSFVEMSHAEIQKLPLASKPVVATIVPGKHPVAKFTVYDQSVMWNEWVRNNPTADREAAWTMFTYQYPSDDGHGPRYRREAGTAQSRGVETRNPMIERSADLSAELNAFGMGEVVTSFRQLLKRYEFVADISNSTQNSTGIVPMVTAGYVAKDANYNQELWDSLYDRISSLYRWQSGSMRLALQPLRDQTETTRGNTVWLQPGFNSLAAPTGASRTILSAAKMPQTGEALCLFFQRRRSGWSCSYRCISVCRLFLLP
jgi:hypothetical protein